VLPRATHLTLDEFKAFYTGLKGGSVVSDDDAYLDELEVNEERASDVDSKNGNDMADLDHDIAKADDELERMGDKETELMATIKSLEEIATSNTSLEELLSKRTAENEAFKQTLKDDDIDAVNVITKVIVALSEYYKNVTKTKFEANFAYKTKDEESVCSSSTTLRRIIRL